MTKICRKQIQGLFEDPFQFVQEHAHLYDKTSLCSRGTLMTYSALRCSAPLLNNGQQVSPAYVVSRYRLNLAPTDSSCSTSAQHVARQVFFGRTLLLPSADGQSIAGHSGAIRRMCPAHRNLLSPTMSCSHRCPLRFSTSALLTLFLHVPPTIFRTFLS